MAMSMVKPLNSELFGAESGSDTSLKGRADFDRGIFREILFQSEQRANSTRMAKGKKDKGMMPTRQNKSADRPKKDLSFHKDFPLFFRDKEKDLSLFIKNFALGIPGGRENLAQGTGMVPLPLGGAGPALEAAYNWIGRGNTVPSLEGVLGALAGKLVKRIVSEAPVGLHKGSVNTAMPSLTVSKVAKSVQKTKNPLPEPLLLQANKEMVRDGDLRKALLQQGKLALKEDYFGEREQLLREYAGFGKGTGHLRDLDSPIGSNISSKVAFMPPSAEQGMAQRDGLKIGLNKPRSNRKTIAGSKVILADGVNEGERLPGRPAVKAVQMPSLATTKQEKDSAKQKGASFSLPNSKKTCRESSSHAVSRVNEKGDREGIAFWDSLSLRQQPTEPAAKVNSGFGAMLPRPQELFEQIIAEARMFNFGQRGEINIKLKPDYLGGLKMKVTVEDGQLKATFIADNPLVKAVLEANMDDLKFDLQKHGLNYQAIDVNVSDGRSSHGFNQSTPSGNFKGIGKVSVAEEMSGCRKYSTGQIDYRI